MSVIWKVLNIIEKLIFQDGIVLFICYVCLIRHMVYYNHFPYVLGFDKLCARVLIDVGYF